MESTHTEQKANGQIQNVSVVVPQKQNLLQKLASAVAEIHNVEKSGRNEFHKYNYVKAADVAWAVRKALSSRNIFLVSDCVEIRNYEIPAKEGVMQAVEVKMQFSFFDGDAPDTAPIVLHTYGTGTDKGDKAIYKAMTGALKYGLRNAFMIPDESDPEADSSVDKATAKANAKAVGEQKLEELKAKMPDGRIFDGQTLLYTWFDESQTATINGPAELMMKHKDLLLPLKVGKQVVANADQLEALKYELEKREVPFKLFKKVGA